MLALLKGIERDQAREGGRGKQTKRGGAVVKQAPRSALPPHLSCGLRLACEAGTRLCGQPPSALLQARLPLPAKGVQGVALRHL